MMRWYVDTSVALHAVLPWGDLRAQRWLDACAARHEQPYASSLLQLELTRALRRVRLELELAAPLLRRVNLLRIDDGELHFAASIEPHVRSLDAIHLAACFLLGPDIRLATHDAGMLEVAAGLGIDAVDPLAWRRGTSGSPPQPPGARGGGGVAPMRRAMRSESSSACS